MKTSLSLIFISILLLASESQGKLTHPSQPDFVRKFDQAIKNSGLKKQNLGIYVSQYEDSMNKVVYTLNGKKQFIPASLTKIVPAAASLELMPQGHQFLTHLKSSGRVNGRVLEGDLYLVGGGDPAFISESMWFLANEFVRNGIEVVRGDIIVDDKRFDSKRFDDGRDPNRVDRAYDAPVGAMSFNWNSVNVYVRPGAKSGAPARVYADPSSRYIRVINKARTVGGSRKSIKVERRSRKNYGSDKFTGDEITVIGSLGVKHDEVVVYKSITEPDRWSGYNLLSFLQQRGIEVSGVVRMGQSPSRAKVLAEAKSKRVAAVVADMMKFSNNYVAEMLTKNLAVEVKSGRGTMLKGVEVLNEYLRGIGFSQRSYNLISPSGFSRSNKFRPMDLHMLLLRMRKKFKVFPEFVSSLPISGVDGTLKKRMNGKAQGWIRAKTGMLNGVSGLAGFAGDKRGGLKTFVFVYNGPSGNTYKARDFFDKLATFMVD